jgi:hypothetical protein
MNVGDNCMGLASLPDGEDHPFGKEDSLLEASVPKSFKGVGAPQTPERYVPRLWGLEALYAAPAAVLGSSRLADILADAAEMEPDDLERLAQRLRKASPEVKAGEHWMESSLRALSATCMCLAKAGRHRAFGSLDYRPEWECQGRSGVSASYDAAISDPAHDAGWWLAGTMELSTVVPKCAEPLERSAPVEDWMEWRGFQSLARAGIPGSGADWAIACARKLDFRSLSLVEHRKFVEACQAEQADREARALDKAAEPASSEAARRGNRI